MEAAIGTESQKRKKISWRLGVAVWIHSCGRCQYCGCGFNYVEEAEIDHNVPLSRGGSTEFENLSIACGPCNRHKSTMTGDEFWDWLNA